SATEVGPSASAIRTAERRFAPHHFTSMPRVRYAVRMRFRHLTVPMLLSLICTAPAYAQPVACQAECSGDCDGKGSVHVAELVRGVSFALENHPLSACESLDGDANGAVSVDELVAAVQRLIQGCQGGPPLEREPVALVRHPSWELVPDAEDIFLPM